MGQAVESMVRDFGDELVRLLRDAKKNSGAEDGFQLGRKLGLYEALSLLVHQVQAFDIDPHSVGLEDVNPDKIYFGQ